MDGAGGSELGTRACTQPPLGTLGGPRAQLGTASVPLCQERPTAMISAPLPERRVVAGLRRDGAWGPVPPRVLLSATLSLARACLQLWRLRRSICPRSLAGEARAHGSLAIQGPMKEEVLGCGEGGPDPRRGPR